MIKQPSFGHTKCEFGNARAWAFPRQTLTVFPQVLERFVDGKASVELQLLGAFCQSEAMGNGTGMASPE